MRLYPILTGLALICAFLLPVKKAEANLLVTPYFVVMEDRDRFGEINLINSGMQTMIYRMSWDFYRMVERGNYEKMEKPDGVDISQYITMSPRQITLRSDEKQTLRLALRRPPELPPGEYRAHLRIMSASAEEKPQTQENQGQGANIGMQMNVGYAIPIIYRVSGGEEARATIGNVTWERARNGNLVLDVPIERTGTYSTIGQLKVYHTPAGGNEELVGEINNANVFPDLNRRIIRVQIGRQDLNNGQLRVVYFKDTKMDERAAIYDEKIIPIGR